MPENVFDSNEVIYAGDIEIRRSGEIACVYADGEQVGLFSYEGMNMNQVIETARRQALWHGLKRIRDRSGFMADTRM